MKLLTLFLFSYSLFAQVTNVVITYDVGSAQHTTAVSGPRGYGGTMQITATGSWTVNIGTCTSLVVKSVTGSGNYTNRFSWDSSGSQFNLTSGQNTTTYNCSGTVTGVSSSSVSFDVTRIIYRRSTIIAASDWDGDKSPFSGCTAPNAASDYTYECSAGTSDPPYDGVAFPAFAGCWTDPRFGGTICRVSNAGHNTLDYATPYNAMRFSKDGLYTYTKERGIISTTTPYTKVAPAPWEVSTSNNILSGCNTGAAGFLFSYASAGSNYGYCYDLLDKRNIRKFSFTPGSPGSITEVCSGSPCSTNPWYQHASDISNGSSGGTGAGTPINRYDQLLVPVAGAGQVCLINLVTKTSSCINHISGRDFRATMLAPDYDSAGFTYGFIGADSPSTTNVIKIGRDGSMVFIGDIFKNDVGVQANTYNYGLGCDATRGECIINGHQHFLFAGRKIALLGQAFGSRTFVNYYSSFAAMYLNAGLFAGHPEESGGGWSGRTPYPTEYGVCAIGAGVCIQTSSGPDTNVRGLENCSGNGTTVTCTIVSPKKTESGEATGFGSSNIYPVNDRILVNRCSVSDWNGFKTVTASSGQSVSFASTVSGGPIYCWATRAVNVTEGNYLRGHVAAFRPDNGHTRVIIKLPSSTLNETYNQLPHIYPDYYGGKFLLNSAFGYPGELSVFISDTGFRCNGREMPWDFCDNAGGLGVTESSGQIAFKIRAPKPTASCSLTYSNLTDYTGGTTSTGIGDRTVTVTGLSAGDIRYANVWCAGNDPNGVERTNWHYAIIKGTAR